MRTEELSKEEIKTGIITYTQIQENVSDTEVSSMKIFKFFMVFKMIRRFMNRRK
ncbi:hypothetical protein SAMN04488053_11534 [Alkalicoccus daliensis]|uniref:Uncharacterized protein n=1 Tax=Alkalicoccus daliensis TaxID=745820 RepID=A0A1H0JYL0_9BACI|nr:hypothetical protein SAMN04488053_11534 [Alkalicoccus daliensis]